MNWLGWGLAILALSGSITSHPQTRTSGHIKSGEWVVHWSSNGAFATHETTPRCVPIFRNSYETGRKEAGFQLGPPPEAWFYRSSHHLLSAAANAISFTEGYEGSGGMHPIYGLRYSTIDLETGDSADITQLFDEDDVVRALRRDPLIMKYLGGAEPTGLEELVTALEVPCEIDFSDLRSAFRIAAIGRDTAVVQFGLGHGCETMRGNFTTLDIELPIPGDLREVFLEAQRNLPKLPEEDPILEAER
jgi:hypothetical protein